jgi:RHS repeat-associated protein
VTQGVQLAAYSYAGRDRLLQRADFAGVVQRYHNGSWSDTAYYDGARRPVKLDFVKGAALLTGIEHGFDRANNRTFTRRLHNASKGDNFVYDSMYRLVTWERDLPAAAVGVPGGSSFKSRHTFELDGAHSRHKTTRALPNQIPVPTVIAVDSVHNYTAKQQGIGPQYTTWSQTFDLNGNKTGFTDQGTHPVYKYDFLNRLRVIEQGTEKVEFDYDAEGKRVRTRVTGLTGYPATTEFIHDGQHVIEEVNGSGQYLRRFYYGDSLDELVGYDNLAFYTGPGSYFYEQDSAGDVVAIHDASGNVVERYTYGAYGSVFFATAGNAAKNIEHSDFGNPYLFKGLRHEAYYDALYYVRARFLDCADGTFMQRDPLGFWGDDLSLGGPKAYCAGNAVNWRDPLGNRVVVHFRWMPETIGLFHASISVTTSSGRTTWGGYPIGSTSGSSTGSCGSSGGGSSGGGSSGGGSSGGGSSGGGSSGGGSSGGGSSGDGSPSGGERATEVFKNDPGDGTGLELDIPPPPGVTGAEWDAAVAEAAEEVRGELGGPPDAASGSPGMPGTSRKPYPSGFGYATAGWSAPDCHDVVDEILRRAAEKVRKKTKDELRYCGAWH